MKKILFAVAAMAMVFATSCKKESINEPENNFNREPEANEFLATVDGGMRENAPAKDGNSTMATFNGLQVMWQDGDAINVNGTTFTCNAVVTTGQTRAYFENGAAFHASHYHAFYSSTVTGFTINQEDSSELSSGTLSAIQTYDPAKLAANLPMYAYSTDHWLDFKNICAAIKIVVPLSTANEIVVSADQDLCGSFTIDADTLKLDNKTAGNNSIKVVKEGNANFQNGEVVYIAIPGGAYTRLNIEFKNGNTVEWATGASTKKQIIISNQIYNINLTKAFKGLLPGKFTVNATGKQVRFTTGNLWYDGTSQNYIENTQDGCAYSNTHIGHFYYSENITGTGGSTYLFCGEGHEISAKANDGASAPTISNLYNLSADEWYYLIGANYTVGKYTVSTPSRRFTHTRLNKGSNLDNLIIVAPDGYTGSDPNYTDIQDYTKAGFLVLANVGYGGTTTPQDLGARYWTSSTGTKGAWLITFGDFNLQFGDGGKTTKRAIRLVQTVTTTP